MDVVILYSKHNLKHLIFKDNNKQLLTGICKKSCKNKQNKTRPTILIKITMILLQLCNKCAVSCQTKMISFQNGESKVKTNIVII